MIGSALLAGGVAGGVAVVAIMVGVEVVAEAGVAVVTIRAAVLRHLLLLLLPHTQRVQSSLSNLPATPTDHDGLLVVRHARPCELAKGRLVRLDLFPR